ncbi:MAG: amidase family protein [Parvularculaceae bacterium]
MIRQIELAVVATLLAACSPAPTQTERIEEPASETYAPGGVTAMTLLELATALRNGEVSAEAATQAYLDRIEKIDRNGPTLQAIIAINPTALDDARALDAKRAAGEPLGALHGVPILLKDNIESADPMATTAGSIALINNVTGRDSPLVAGLRAEGAVILGKTNMSEWANFRSNDSLSGWSGVGGQVKNPHMLDRNPCGSSSGSGAAVAASLAAGAVGTETNGSIICPSNVNGIVGFKPSTGLVSGKYIVPISPVQDTAGPMTKTVTGAAMMLNAMATGEAKTDYVAALDADSLKGARIGVLRFSVGENPDINEKFDAALTTLGDAGAVLVDIGSFDLATENYGDKSLAVLEYEFKASLNDYLADAAPEVRIRTLHDLIAFNAHTERELALFDQRLFLESEAKGGLNEPEYVCPRAPI